MTSRKPSTPGAPPKLSAVMSAFWKATNTTWELEEHQLRLLTLACRAYDRSEQARALVDKEGLTVPTARGGMRAHPALAVERDSRLAFARIIRELGLDQVDAGPARGPRIWGQRY